VFETGAARRSDNPQTKKTPLLRLVMVHRDLDFIGKTITINLSVVTATRLRIDATPERTLEYSAILQALAFTNSRAKYCTTSIGPYTNTSSKSAIVKDMRKILVPVLFLRSAVAIVKRVMRFPIAPKPMQTK
jgi:hypothetical protein